MPNFKETRACLTLLETSLSTNKNLLFYTMFTKSEFLYWNYEKFDLDEKTNNECLRKHRKLAARPANCAGKMLLLTSSTMTRRR